MKHYKFILILSGILILNISYLFPQKNFTLSAGARIAPSSGITVKGFLKNSNSLEGMLTSRWGDLKITGLFELNQVFFEAENINFFYGAGLHVGYWNGVKDVSWFNPQGGKIITGIDGIIGIGITFSNTPFNVSLEWKPEFNIGWYTGARMDELGLSVRYIIKR